MKKRIWIWGLELLWMFNVLDTGRACCVLIYWAVPFML